MGNDDHGGAALTVDLLEGLRQPGEGPQVDACLRLVEDHQVGVPGQNGGDLNALDLAAGEGHIHFTVQIVIGAEPHLGEVLAAFVLGELFIARGDGQKVPDRQPLEAGRLLKAVADAKLGPFRNSHVGNVLTVPDDLAGRGGDEAHDDFCQRGLSAAVGAGKDYQTVLVDAQGDVLQNVQRSLRLLNGVADVLEFQHGISSF